MRTILYDYQEETANDIFNRMVKNEIRGAYLGFETGTGKTITSLSVVERLHEANSWGIDLGLVVICPVSKVDDWKRDIKEELPKVKISFVSSFQSAWRDKNANQIKEILAQPVSCLIIDEGHKMKTYDSKQSKFIQNIAEKYKPFTLILSATSQNKKYIDLYPQYKTIGSEIFNLKPKDFKNKYCIEQMNYNLVYSGKSRFPFNEIIGYKNIDIMDKEILSYTYYKKYESDYDKPIEITQTFKITSEMKYFKENKVWPKMDEKALEEALASGDMEDVETDFIIANRPTLFRTYMRECCSGFIKNYFLDKNPKLQWLEDFMEGNESRFVVFTNFINETIMIKELCTKKKRHCVIYDGSNKDLSKWYEYDDCIAIVNVQAGSAGLNDFIKTNIAIYFSLPENYIDFEQSKGRINRIGQTKQPIYYYLEVIGGVEPSIHKTLQEGKDFDLHLFECWMEEKE
ncbi:MAG: DEAD/DEAH box helicase [Anaeroplasmataceae bacterium]|nr:DEAD/DEAH box helicase [Anaeroplasmataceae bacterium]